ncbi:MAG: hypothetical protein ACD_19C00187G0006 [uncultured bacterium]|nr:MAG: hypothetical protein ACD_19C00187G0006 [uncultured bacterium]
MDYYTNQITTDELDEVKKIYLQDYGRAIDDKEALEIATNTLAMVKAVYGKLPVVK